MPDFADVADWVYRVWGPEPVDLRAEPPWPVPEIVAIEATPVGAFFMRSQNPHQPYLPEEILAETEACLAAGATGVHLHMRNPQGVPVRKPEYYRNVVAELRARHGDRVIISGCSAFKTMGATAELISAGVFEVTPVNPTTCRIGNGYLAFEPSYIQTHGRLIVEQGLKPQIGIYTDGDVDSAYRYLIEPGILQPPYYWGVVTSLPGCSTMRNPMAMTEGVTNLIRRIRDVAPDSVIQLRTSGRASSYVGALAIMLGCHVGVGMEDTIYRWPHRDELIERNDQIVGQMVAIATALGRRVATADEYRRLLGMPARAGVAPA